VGQTDGCVLPGLLLIAMRSSTQTCNTLNEAGA